MSDKRQTSLWLSLFLLTFVALAGCRRSDPDAGPRLTLLPSLTPPHTPTFTPTPTPTITPTPTNTPTVTPTPTNTPIPPVYLTIEFPRLVNALQPVPIRVLTEEPMGIEANVRLSARVIDATDQLYATFDLVPEGGEGWWVAGGTLQLPLEPEPYPGVWHLIIDAEADWPIWGYRDRVFTPQRVPYHILTDTLPVGAELRVPEAFAEVVAQGDSFAGLRTWHYGDCEVTLAWAPGPTEDLLADNALVMAEATFDRGYRINVEASEETTWGEAGWTAFAFYELWRDEGKNTPAETLVVQGPNYQLFVLRIRSRGQDEIHALCRDVRETFGVAEEE